MSQWKTKVIEGSETIFFLAVFVQKARMLRWITQDFFFPFPMMPCQRRMFKADSYVWARALAPRFSGGTCISVMYFISSNPGTSWIWIGVGRAMGAAVLIGPIFPKG